MLCECEHTARAGERRTIGLVVELQRDEERYHGDSRPDCEGQRTVSQWPQRLGDIALADHGGDATAREENADRDGAIEAEKNGAGEDLQRERAGADETPTPVARVDAALDAPGR